MRLVDAYKGPGDAEITRSARIPRSPGSFAGCLDGSSTGVLHESQERGREGDDSITRALFSRTFMIAFKKRLAKEAGGGQQGRRLSA